MYHKILIIVDPQNDFIFGSLAVPGASGVMDKLCNHINEYGYSYQYIIVTRDWHPKNHCSFMDNGGIWTEHCVADTWGSEIYEPLQKALNRFEKEKNNVRYVYKGMCSDMEEYSAFASNDKLPEELYYLITNVGKNGFEVVYTGIAGDYCVKESLYDMMKILPEIEYHILPDCIASIDGGKTVNKIVDELNIYNKCSKYKQIIHHFTDNDLYTFTCQYFCLMNFPRAVMEYKFTDRNNTVYPPGFDKGLKVHLARMKNVVITEEEIEFMKRKINFLPDWYYTFLRGFRFNPDEVTIKQDENGHLDISIRGSWFSSIFWEMPILSIISQLMHYLRGEYEQYDTQKEYDYAYEKAKKAIENGLKLADMGTRRRFSFEHHKLVVQAMKDADETVSGPGMITGTSNVYFAMLYDMTPIGTMSHQTISFIEGTMSNPFEANYYMMDLWSKTFDGNCGIYLNDCFTSDAFLKSFSLRQAKLWDGVRIDSGDEYEETDKMIAKYENFGIDSKTKKIVYSNGLDINKAIEIHRGVCDVVDDSYGIGTYLTCNLTYPVKPMNIVIKAYRGRITEKREDHWLVKISNDRGKSVGDKKTCEYIRKMLDETEEK